MSVRADAAWKQWCADANARAEVRWKALQGVGLLTKNGQDWLKDIRKRLALLAEMKILGPHEHSRLIEVKFRDLAAVDQDRLKSAGLERRLFAFGLARGQAEEEQRLARRSMQLNDSTNLCDGRLGLQVFVDERQGRAVGMNIQLRGLDPHRQRPCYLRYDLDVVPLGKSPVTHFSAHWHAGDDPEGDDAEEHDPRLPALILDPLAVLDVLIETFFPEGPASVLND